MSLKSISEPKTNRFLAGKVGPIGLVLGVRAVSLAALLFAYYLLAFFVAVTVVPLLMGYVMTGTGITSDMPLDSIIALWLAPSLFLVALVFVGLLIIMRALWRLRTRMVTEISRWALGESTGEAAPGKFKTKSVQNRSKSVTKAA